MFAGWLFPDKMVKWAHDVVSGPSIEWRTTMVASNNATAGAVALQN